MIVIWNWTHVQWALFSLGRNNAHFRSREKFKTENTRLEVWSLRDQRSSKITTAVYESNHCDLNPGRIAILEILFRQIIINPRFVIQICHLLEEQMMQINWCVLNWCVSYTFPHTKMFSDLEQILSGIFKINCLFINEKMIDLWKRL